MNREYHIINEDARTALRRFRGRADLIVTSPPYADARKRHYDSIDPDEYATWFASFHEPLAEALKPEGSLVINIKDKVVDGVRHRYVWDTIRTLERLGWYAIDDYLWHKPNAMPGFWPTRLRDAWEYCFQGPPRDWGCGSKRVLSGLLIGERRQRGLDREAGKHRGRGRRTQHGGHADRPT